MEKKAEEKKETLCCMEVQSANDNDARITVAVQVKGSAEDVAGFIVRMLNIEAIHSGTAVADICALEGDKIP